MMRVIAEIGLNANGVPWLLLDTIRAFAAAGATDVKLQVRDVHAVYSEDFLASPRASPWGSTQRAQKQAMEYDDAALIEAAGECRRLGVDMSASCWDPGSVERFVQIVRPAWLKVASPALGNLDRPLLRAYAKAGVPLLVSTGMSDLATIAEALHELEGAGPVTLLQCTSTYPSEPEETHLRAIETLRREFGLPVGLSYHGRRPEPVIAAVALGIACVEVHVTLSRALTGSDQRASWTPDEFAALVESMRIAKAAMGSPEKRVLPREEAIRTKLRRG